MTDFYLGVIPQSVEWELRANVARFSAPMGGVTRTLERVGSRWAANFKWDVVGGTEAAQLRAFLAQQRGGANRFWFSDPAYTQRGSFAAPELLANLDFSSGTAGWGGGGSLVALTAADNIIRATLTGSTSSPQIQQTGLIGVQYAPYAAQGVVVHGRGAVAAYQTYIADSTISSASSARTNGKGTAWFVPLGTSLTVIPTYNGIISSGVAGDYFGVPFASAARCALVDNGKNALLRSDEIDNASWTKNAATVSANLGGGPDGTTTADGLFETATTNDHYAAQTITVPASAADYSFSIACRAGAIRTWMRLQLNENTGTTAITGYFNLSTGAIGTLAAGANWSNVRGFTQDIGNGWFVFTIVGRKTNAATGLTAFALLATADNASTNYAGNASAFMYLWRATLADSSVPSRLTQTTTTATTGTAQTGSAVYLKGLPASTDGLLLAGDWVEFITPTYSEAKRVTAPLNSDSAGLGYLQLEPTFRQSPADNAAVIIRRPLCRMLLDEPTVKTQHMRGGVMSVSFTAVEDVAA